MALRRIVVTHTSSHVFDQETLDKAWEAIKPLTPGMVLRGSEDADAADRAMTVYEALGDSLLELFHPLQDDDVGYEVEDYDPEA